MSNQVLDVISSRRSIRDYSPEALTKEEVQALVDAALIAPSAMNAQPWHLTVANDREVVLEMEQDVVDFFVKTGQAETAARIASRNNKIFYDAATVFFISMKPGAGMDVGIMAQSIALAAKSMGLDSVILGLPGVVFGAEKAEYWKEKLLFPAGYEYGIAVAVGHGTMAGVDRERDYSKVSYIG